MKIGGETTDQTITDGDNNTQVGGDLTLNGISFEDHQKVVKEKDAKIENLIIEKTRALASLDQASERGAAVLHELEDLKIQHVELRKMHKDPVAAYRDHQKREKEMGEILCDIGMVNTLGHNRIQAALDDFNALDYDAVDVLLAEQEHEGILIAIKSALGRGLNAENAIRWQEAYDHYKRAYGLDAGNMDALESHARLTWRLGKAEEGIPLHEHLRDWAREVHGKESNDYATSLNNLAELYRAQNRLSAAELLYEEALAIRRAALPEGHPDIAIGLYSLAVLYCYLERFDAEVPLLREALEIWEKALPEGHPYTEHTRRLLEVVYELRPDLRDM